MNRININNLAMIITNKCNLECLHCLYKNDDIDMSSQVIDKTFEQVNKVTNLHIYGGEPVIAIETLEHMFNSIISNRIKINTLDITINGTKYDEDFIRLLDYINRYLVYTSSNSSVRLSILRDTEHKNSLKRLGLYRETLAYIKKYMESKYFYELCKEPRIITQSSEFSDTYITYMNKIKLFNRKSGTCHIGPLVTINPKGIVTKADATIEEQEELYNYGNINSESIEDICLRNSKVLKPLDWYNKTSCATRK